MLSSMEDPAHRILVEAANRGDPIVEFISDGVLQLHLGSLMSQNCSG